MRDEEEGGAHQRHGEDAEADAVEQDPARLQPPLRVIIYYYYYYYYYYYVRHPARVKPPCL